ncbi:MAG: T9SS type A sorting domain-containing protein [Bacteroidetes bacterium]|nr:T9SS type A sorting domain-containing protein [Bacteroidota bacterium]
MIKKLMLSLCAVASSFGFAAQAQQGKTCGTDDFYRAQLAKHPEIRIQEDQLKADIDRYVLGKITSHSNAKTAFDANDALVPWPDDTTEYHIPIVFHIIYDDGGSAINITDDDIYNMVDRLNTYYNAKDSRLSGILNNWKPYIGNPHISFHLAGKDPNGKPSHGITRYYSYASDKGDEGAKFDQWPPDQYLNIWLINVIGRGASQGIVLAYATFPTSYGANPYSQGVIARADQVYPNPPTGDPYTLPHEIGHFLYLYHPWNNNGKDVEDTTACGDDEVDDTPPTYGHFSCGPSKLYDTHCAVGYYKDYDSVTYYHMTGNSFPSTVTSNTTTDVSVPYMPSSGMSLGQTFKTDALNSYLLAITLMADTGNTGNDSMAMRVYDATGTTLIANSTNNLHFNASASMVFNFPNVTLLANTTYKFVLVSLGGTKNFALRGSNNNPYSNGMLYAGIGANTAVSGSDLYFTVSRAYRMDYPDTTNTQNIMDYSGCYNEMFTKGQVARMRAALRSNVGNRSNLIDTTNLIRTGVMNSDGSFAPLPNMSPTALFTINRPFICADGSATVTFTNRSYNDTISTASWSFDHGGNSSTGLNTASTSFNQAGWVNATLLVTDNDGDTGSLSRNDMVYAADPNGVQPYPEEFNPGSPMIDRFPMFNYFKNPTYNWQLCSTAGYYDKTSIKFNNFDPRDPNSVIGGTALNTATQSPRGLYGDFYTPAYDLTSLTTGDCYLSFYSAGANRTVVPNKMNDTLIVSYSTNCGGTWTEMGRLSGGQLCNNGEIPVYFEPQWMGNWRQQAFNVPAFARTSRTYFRFRFMPGTDNAYLNYSGLDFGTGNNLYIDRLTLSAFGLGVKNGIVTDLGLSVTPNPTNSSATIEFNGGDHGAAEISVTDVTGKLIYHTSVARTEVVTQVQIPASVLTTKGMYLVQVVTNGATQTRKLVVY